MGCWNATCNVTNLPICGGDDIVLIPLIKVKEDAEFNVSNPTDVFVPLAFPIFGKYNEYGGIEDVVTSEHNRRHLCSFEYFLLHDEEYVPAMYDGFDNLIENALCSCGGVYVKTDSFLHHEGMAELNHMMIHRGVYDVLMKEAAGRKVYGEKISLQKYLLSEINKAMSHTNETIQSYRKVADQIPDDPKSAALRDLSEFTAYGELVHTLFAPTALNPCAKQWINTIKREMYDNQAALVDDFVSLLLLTRALDWLRKGFLCDSGAGSQSTETRMHYLVAEWTMKHIKRKSVSGTCETIFS